jgi:hypothetical protein
MKHLFFVVATLPTWQCIYATHLVNALNSKEVSIEMHGAIQKEIPESMRNAPFAPKLQMELKNNSNVPLKIELEEGYMMEPTEKGYQALLMTKPMMITLQPKSGSKQFLYAMCTQLSMSSPNATIKYKIGKKAPDALLKLAQHIAKKDYQNFAAQQAVWSISDNSPTLSISGNSKDMENDLQSFVANIKGEDLEKLKLENHGKNLAAIMSVYNGKKLDRNIVFKTDTSSIVSVGYYNEQGELIKPLFENVHFKNGQHSIRYNPFPLALASKRYSVRLTKDDEVFREYYFMQ